MEPYRLKLYNYNHVQYMAQTWLSVLMQVCGWWYLAQMRDIETPLAQLCTNNLYLTRLLSKLRFSET